VIAKRAALLGAVLALAAPARAQDVVAFGPSPPRDSTSVDVNVTGSLVVTFHGDAASGCAFRGVCAYSGIVVWRPQQGSASLDIEKLRRHGRSSYAVTFYNSPNPYVGPPVFAAVRDTVPGQATGTCADDSSSSSYSALPVHGSLLTVAAFGGDSSLLSTRCAGPLAADLAPSLRTRVISIRSALRGHQRIDLSGVSSFAAGGFAGTVSSTLVLQLGDAHGNSPSGSSPGGRRLRVVTESLTLLHMTGVISAQVRDSADSNICALLDSCGVRGAITIQPRPGRSQGGLTAFGPAIRPYRDFLAALGLSRVGNPGGISVTGGIGWKSGGTLQSDLTQGGECRDTTALGSGDILFLPGARSVTARYVAIDSLRVRCPGPELSPARGGDGLASTGFPIRRLAPGQFSIALPATRTLIDDGYTVQLTGALTLAIKRGRPTERLIRLPG
jgi:hypothetical protein